MTHNQLAAARRVMSQFPMLRITKSGDILAPIKDGVAGTSVEVTDAMATFEIEKQLRASCHALNG